MLKKLKLYLSDSSSFIFVIFTIGALLILFVTIADGVVGSDEIGNFLTFLVAFSAYLSLQASNASLNKKLQIEQQPLVVISLPISADPTPLPTNLIAKNIGRGPALGVRVGSNRFKDNQMLFDSSQPESVDLAAGESKVDWSLDDKMISELLVEKEQFNLFLSYTDQLGNLYEMRTDLQLQGGYWRVSQNIRIS